MEVNKIRFQTQSFTVEDFDKFIELPENADKVFELIGREITEVTSNTVSSQIAIEIAFYIKLHLFQNNLSGAVMGADGGYMVSGERYCPDVSYSAKKLEPVTYNPFPPDLAVEVISSSDSIKSISTKISNYLAAGTVVWAVYPDEAVVMIHAPGQPVQTLTEKDTLEGGSILPGFSVALPLIFKVTAESPKEEAQDK
ncbi:MAG: Uma2 family endonuclease, partial [Anaerolineae bacterium]|nr:Uma2 family endonuclease [Anaerolineae bacterium]